LAWRFPGPALEHFSSQALNFPSLHCHDRRSPSFFATHQWRQFGRDWLSLDNDLGWKDSSGSWEAGSNWASRCVWLHLLLVRYKIISCLVACMNKKFWIYGTWAHTLYLHRVIVLHHEGRRNREDRSMWGGDEERSGRGCRQTVGDTLPNKAKVHNTMLDKHLDDSSRATNHPQRPLPFPPAFSL